MACTRGASNGTIPDVLTWPFRWLDRAAGAQVADWFSEEQIADWKKNGLEDFEADEVCIRLGLMPHDVFPGYLEAGLDQGHYP